MDDFAVAGEAMLDLDHSTGNWSVLDIPMKSLYHHARTSAFEHQSASKPGVRYIVTVQRLPFLLPVAKTWKWVIWSATTVKTIDCSGR